MELHPPGHLRDDAQPGGVVGRLDRANQPAGQPRGQLRPQLGKLGRRTVGRENQLPPLAEERVDGVEQFDLRGPLADEELQVVDHQQPDAAVLAAEAGQAAAAKRFEKMAGELLGREVHRRQTLVRLSRRGPNAFQEMGLAHAGRSVEHQRRVLARLTDDHLRRGDGQAIRLSGHERVEAGEAAPLYGGGRSGRRRRRWRSTATGRGPGRTCFTAPLITAACIGSPSSLVAASR